MWVKIVAVIGLVTLLGAACGNDDGDGDGDAAGGNGETTEQTDGDGGVPSTTTGAAELRAGLTSLLQEHVYVAGIALSTGASAGLDSPEFEAAAATLDENSVALADAVGSVYPDAREAFLELWRKHIGFFVDYTAAKAEGDEAAAEAAREELDGYRADFGAFLGGANPNLTEDAVAEELVPHVETVIATIDAVAAGEASVFGNLREAAQVMPGTANVLAGAIVGQFPDQFDGSTDSGAAELRAGLTHLLQEHVYLAGIAIDTGVSAGLDSPEFEAAAATLDENSVALADAVGSVYPDAREAFLELWRKHIGFFVDYTAAKAEGDEAAAEAAREELDGYRADFGAFLGGANPNLTEDAVAEELVPHVETVIATIDAVAAGEASVFGNLREAAQVMPGTANVLAGAIVGQFPDQF